jgi:hypothetical protein
MPTLKTNLATAVSLICTATAFAGDLNAPSAPTDPGSAMYQLEDVYNRLNDGSTGSKRSGSFVEPDSAPGSTGHTLDDVMSKAPVADNVNGVQPAGALAGETYWSLRTDGAWGLQTGSMPNNGTTNYTPGTSDQSISEGYHSGSGVVIGDADLTTPNIAEGVNLFNVVGTAKVALGNAADAQVLSGVTYSNASGSSTGSMPDKEGANASIGQYAALGINSFIAPTGFYDGDDTVTATDAQVRALDGDIAAGNIVSGAEIFGVAGTANVSVYTALVPESGQTTQYDANDPQADDGAGHGVDLPTHDRFTDHGDGTVTDELTGLMWLKDANCPNVTRTWQTALNDVVNLNASGTINSQSCADYSGMPYTDWRLPTRNVTIQVPGFMNAGNSPWNKSVSASVDDTPFLRQVDI